MMAYIRCELHNHTYASDGEMSPEILVHRAKERGYKAICLTDHNTISNVEKTKRIGKDNGLLVIEGIEWTTFFGHIVVLGGHNNIDWREITNENIKSITYPKNSTSNFECIYSLTGCDLICFDFRQKKFDIISINDNTRGIFTSYISYYKQNKLRPLLLNTQKNFFILMQKFIFYYDYSLNSINILTKTISNHLNGNFIQIENSLYSISGNNNTQCELYSLIINQNKLLPSTNYPRINSGICNINNEYIYLFFGQFCQNSIERLNIKNLNYDEKWEIIKINEINGVNNNIINLDKFISFLDDYNNVIIFGGEDYNNEKGNKNIFGFNLNDNSISVIGKIDSCATYVNQYIKLDESIFSVFDENNGLHFFSKELDYHEIFNLNL
mgnify:CR=1 FL=1